MSLATRLGLRVRIFLFFALIAAAGVLGHAAGIAFAYARADGAIALAPMLQAAALGAAVLLGAVIGVWLLFDENVARPLVGLASAMRSRAHSDVRRDIDPGTARYLGDLAPAARAVAATLHESRAENERAIEERCEHAAREQRRFAAILRDAPVALILCTRAHRVAFYNDAALELFGSGDDALDRGGELGLHRPIFDLFSEDALRGALDALAAGRDEAETDCTDAEGRPLALRLATVHLDDDSEPDGYVIVARLRETAPAAPAARRARCDSRYDFDLMARRADAAEMARTLPQLDYVVFDTETTGLDPAQDEIVQIAGVRIVNGRIVDGEIFDTLVDPGRRIPAGSTRIHGITDAMVQGAPTVDLAVRRFHRFCRDAVLVAHNAPFDLAFLRKAEEGAGCRFDRPALDTVLLSALVFGRQDEHSLDALAARLDVTIPEAHRHTALGDSLATARVFLKLEPLLAAMDVRTLKQAIDAENAIRRRVGMARVNDAAATDSGSP